MTVKTKKKGSITRHPVFPVMVALWFAALLGMGSLLLRAELLESLVVAIRLDRIVPAAAPPLGFTARTLVAVLLAGAGGLIGYLLARSLGATAGADRGKTSQPPVERGAAASVDADANPAAPIEPLHADDNDDLARLEAARESHPGRRRGLNAQLVVDPFEPPVHAAMPEPAILNLGELTAIEPIEPYPASATLPEPTIEPSVSEPAAFAPGSLAGRPQIEPAGAADPVSEAASSLAEPLAARTSALRPRQGTAADVLRQAPLDTLGVVELVERFALALAARRAREHATESLGENAGTPLIGESSSPDRAAGLANGHSRRFDVPAEPRSSAHQDDQAQPEDASDHDAAEALPREFADDGHLRGLEDGGWALPDLEDEADESENALAPQAAWSDSAAEDAAVGADEQAFSSLLAMKPAARAAALLPNGARTLEEATEANGQSIGHVAGPEATEEALRKALATLQRMSGAA